MITDVALLVVNYLDANVSGLDKTTNLRVGRMRSVPVGQAAFVLEIGGVAPVNFPTASGAHNMYDLGVQVSVRSNRKQYEAGNTLAREVYSTLHRATIPGIAMLTCDQSAPIYFEERDDGEHIWTINLTARYTG